MLYCCSVAEEVKDNLNSNRLHIGSLIDVKPATDSETCPNFGKFSEIIKSILFRELRIFP